MSTEMLLQLGLQALAAAAIYGGIRADLRHAIDQSEMAHRRIDAMLGADAIAKRNRG